MNLRDDSLGDIVARTIADGKAYASAELAVIKLKTTSKIAGYRTAAVWLTVAGLFGLIGLIVLPVGLILTLTPLVGPGWATLIVVGSIMLIAGLCGVVGIRRIKRI